MFRIFRRGFKVMNREEYRENYRIATLARKMDTLEMPDYLAPDGGPNPREEKVVLNAVPEVPLKSLDFNTDPFYNILYEYHPELIFLQVNPMPYLARQRYVSYQLALQGDEDYNKKSVYSLDNPVPLSWDECVVNLVTLDCIRQNVSYKDLDLTTSLATYSYPTHQPYEVTQRLTDPFIAAIAQHVAGGDLSKYHYINNILYLALMGKCKVMLADMPEALLRLQLGNTVPLTTVREIYGFIVDKLVQHYAQHPDVLVTMEEMTLHYFPHIFQVPRDLYLTALLKEAFPASGITAAFVGAPHYVPIQRYWVGPPMGINYTQATYVPPRIPNETDEMLIEKQALFDLLLDSKVWGQKYITNPFLYITEDITGIKEKDLAYFKNYFQKMVAVHSKGRDQKLATKNLLTR